VALLDDKIRKRLFSDHPGVPTMWLIRFFSLVIQVCIFEISPQLNYQSVKDPVTLNAIGAVCFILEHSSYEKLFSV